MKYVSKHGKWLATFLLVTIVVASSVLAISAVNPANAIAAGQTKIAPTEAAPPHPFTIIDTPEGRLVDGSVAIFCLNGVETVIPLKTHKPYMTAQGNLPAGMGGGDYQVSIRQPNGTEFVVGMFKVLAPVAEPSVPTITPTSGSPGSQFVITDPEGRMQPGDLAVFYVEGTDPAFGNPATDVVINAEGTTLTGNVPGGAVRGTQHYVTVRPTQNSPSRFADLAFYVTM